MIINNMAAVGYTEVSACIMAQATYIGYSPHGNRIRRIRNDPFYDRVNYGETKHFRLIKFMDRILYTRPQQAYNFNQWLRMV